MLLVFLLNNFNTYAFSLISLYRSRIQPKIKKEPPIGVIGPNQLIFILIIDWNERNKILKEKINDERVILINDSAEKIGFYIKNQKKNKVDYIISALPLSLIPIDIKNSIIQNSIEYLKIDGQYVQFQYTPYDYRRLKRYFNKVKLSLTFTNFPPAFLYRCYP